MAKRERKQGAFILLDKESGDCKRFNNIKELLLEFGYSTDYGESLKRVLQKERIKNKYMLFAYEEDILSW